MTTYCSIWGSSDRPVKNIYTCFWRCLECPIISWRNFNISAPLWDPFCKFLPFLKGWLWVCRSEEPQMMPRVYFHLCMWMQRERAGGGGVAWGWGKVKAFPHQHSFTFSLSSRLCAFARYLRVFIRRCNTKQRRAESLLTAYRCQNAAFLTLPLCGEEFRSLSCWEESLWCCMNPISLLLQAAVRLRESDAFLPSQRDDAPSRASDLPASLATSAVMVPWWKQGTIHI